MKDNVRVLRPLLLSGVLLLIGVVLIWKGIPDFSVVPVSLEEEQSTFLEVADDSSLSAALANIATESGVIVPDSGEIVKVTRVVDGDTIEVLIGGKNVPVRFIGIDTPETVDPRRPVGCFGKEASNETRRLLDGKSVVLKKDITDTDKYGRLLRYVFLVQDDGNWLFVNDYLVRAGFAKSSSYPPDVKYQDRFVEGETEARNGGLGLWGDKCS